MRFIRNASNKTDSPREREHASQIRQNTRSDYTLPFSTLADPLTLDFFLCPFIRFLHFAVCNLHAAAMIPSPPPTVSPSTYARALIELSQTFPFLCRYETTILEIYPEILSFLSRIYIYTRFTFLSVSLSNITRGYDPYVAMPPLISNITPIRERHLCDVSIESICCYRCHVMRGTRV